MKACAYSVVVATACLSSMSFASDDIFLLSYFKGNGEPGILISKRIKS